MRVSEPMVVCVLLHGDAAPAQRAEHAVKQRANCGALEDHVRAAERMQQVRGRVGGGWSGWAGV